MPATTASESPRTATAPAFGTPLLRREPPDRAQPERSAVRATRVHTNRGNEKFQPLPHPTGKPPYRINVESYLSKSDVQAIRKAGKIVFHTAGDTGGIKDAVPQTIVAKKMTEQLTLPKPDRPAFFYHLGDVVYFMGEAENYFPQFYEAYEHYSVPMFAIPGNHDGIPPRDGVPSLKAFMENFCAKEAKHTPQAVDVDRTAMTQPNCYFTLITPFATIVGLYTNVPSGGVVKDDQLAWFVGELKAADKNRALIVCLHHPIYSADDHHSGSEALEARIHGAFETAKRIPDVVLMGHVHNYQRFTRMFKNKAVPYFVVGAGGYHNLHGMVKATDGGELPVPHLITANPRLQLEDYAKSRHGFARITASRDEVVIEYFTVPRPHESWSHPAERYDTCRLNWRMGKILPS